ncbi:hypothetical protein FRC11_002440, partial [Ceratobasidium sp. 423]
MPGNKPEIIPPPPPKPVSPPNSAQGATMHSGPFPLDQITHSPSRLGGHPPPPPPHTPPPPNPKSARLRDRASAGDEYAPATMPGYPPPPPPHSPPPPPAPKSQSGYYTAVPAFNSPVAFLIALIYHGMRIYPANGLSPNDSAPKPPAGTDIPCAKAVKFGVGLLPFQGGLCD